ncbi:MAG: hypothetical protein LBH44_06465 [Treponema sp.]|jgi:hypothetical protein|nr:hypothetical protein [Treponema sp.]
MRLRPVLPILLFAIVLSGLFAQTDDAEVAGQYVKWVEQAMAEGRWNEAAAAIERAAAFSGVSSDISYLLALSRRHEGKSRNVILEALDRAIETNRWVNYSETQALLLKAGHLTGMRSYSTALELLEEAGDSADSAVLRLLALRGLAADHDTAQINIDPLNALARFRSRVLETMDKYPRDPRPLRIFLEYARGTSLQKAHNRKPEPSMLAESDLNLLELALRRLPFLLETDPELAWMAAPFIRDMETARRYIVSYRAGALTPQANENFKPSPGSVAVALNLGIIGDNDAVNELLKTDGELVLHKDIITEIDGLLRTEEGRRLLSQKLHSFSGIITYNTDHDGYAESTTVYREGTLQEVTFDFRRSGSADLRISFGDGGFPLSAERRIAGDSYARVRWERYPAVLEVNLAAETFLFRPAEFQFAPVTLIELGGSNNYAGLAYPVLQYQNTELTRRTLVSFCSSLRRPSVEFYGAVEEIFLERGIPRQAVETLNGKRVSVTDFANGAPVIQRLDLDLDGRMETIRRFRRPGPDFSEFLDYRSLISSSESDWTGDGLYKTGEVYLQDGSVVYSWDMEGGGIMDHSETKNGNDR